MYRVGIIGHRPEYIQNHISVESTVRRIIDVISYQYEDLVINVGGEIGVDQWAADFCRQNKIKYHMFLPCPPDYLSSEWYDDQKQTLTNCFNNSWATTIYSKEYDYDIERSNYKNVVDMSDFLICFWNGMRQGPTYDCIKYALEKNKLVLSGLNDLKLVTNEDI